MMNYSSSYDSALGEYITSAPWWNGVKAIVLGEGVTSIGDSAFYGCSSLSSITIPEGVTSIGSYAFSGCSSLSSVYAANLESWLGISFSYGGNPTYNGARLYTNGELVTNKITIPEGVTSIGSYAFHNWSSLSSITIPEGVTSIGSYAFYGCSSLSSIYIPDSVTSIASDAITYSKTTIYCNQSSYAETWAKQQNQKYILLDSKEPEEYLTITLPDTMNFEFWKPQVVQYSIFPKLPDMILTWTSSDTSIVTVKDGVATPVGNGSAVITLTVNGVSASCTVTVRNLVRSVLPASLVEIEEEACAGTAVECYVLPDGVTTIGLRAFANCTNLERIEIPASMTSIATNSFAGCSGLTIIAPEGSTAHSFANNSGYAWRSE